MSRFRIKAKKRLRCRKCNAMYGGSNYLVRKDGYGWVCLRCGYIKPEEKNEQV